VLRHLLLMMMMMMMMMLVCWSLVSRAVAVTCCSVFERLRHMRDSFRADFFQVIPDISCCMVAVVVLDVACCCWIHVS
jgi:hypothetical protein